MFYLYRFINATDKIIYIGRTNDINRRIINEHFTDNTHLPSSCYLETEKIEYAQIINESEEVAYEAILINQFKPKYNSQFVDGGIFDIRLPNFKWVQFQWQYEGQFNWLKERKRGIVNFKNSVINYFNDTKINIITTGIWSVDDKMVMPPQSMTLVAGVSGIGKTSYCLNIANHNVKNGKKVLYIALKDSIESNTMKLLSIDNMIPLKRIYNKQFSDEEWDDFKKKLLDINERQMIFYNVDKGFFNLDHIIEEIKCCCPDLLIIDDIQMIEYEGIEYAKDKLEYILKNLKKLCVQLSIPIIYSYCVSDIKIQARLEKRPLLTDLDYNSLYSYSDNIQFIYRDEVYYDWTTECNVAEINLVKSIFNEKHLIKTCFVNGKFIEKENGKS